MTSLPGGSHSASNRDDAIIATQSRRRPANGYILFYFSERVFWSFWRPGDSLPEFLVTRFAYCLLVGTSSSW